MKLSLDAFLALAHKRLSSFEEYWEKELAKRSPDEMPIDARFASEETWEERLSEATADGAI